MPPTKPSSPQASPVASSHPDRSAADGLWAIHQPNFLPRLYTLAKLYAADCWIVLDNVQFAHPYWSTLDAVIAPVLELLAVSDRTAVISEASTRLLLNLLGRHGSVVRSSAYPARVCRSERLADLGRAASAVAYL